ncbi:MAG: hypothetical protein AAF939_05715 [Planctomycetota bacterium]
MQAVCYKCGNEKQDPLKMCGACHALPESDEDRIVSICLSDQCLKQKHLLVATQYIKTKKKLPGIHPNVAKKARQIHAKLPRRPINASQSIELSASFFQEDLFADDSEPERVTVHVIGKPKGVKPNQFVEIQKMRTCHSLTWTVGEEVSQSDHDIYADTTGQLYLWYRWINDQWKAKFIPKQEFYRLRDVENSTL